METLTTTTASVPTTSHSASPVHEAHANPASPNASQDSVTSLQSHEARPAFKPYSSRSSIVSSSQNTSNTELTSPSSSVESVAVYEGNSNEAKPPGQTRDRTPERPIPHALTEEDNTPFSPMSVTSPIALNGAKRTASGQVKSTPTLPSTPRQYGHRSRQHSVSSTGSRASEIAASLKTRLGYAMAKVHHGWEHKSLVEVEQLAAYRLSPNRFSASSVDSRPNLAGLVHANSSTQDLYSRAGLDRSASPPPKRHSANFSTYLQSLHQGGPSFGPAPQLQPAVDIRPGSGHRLSRSARYHPADDAMSPPRTPLNHQPRRPPIIRTQTQTAEAERDALQALFQLGSPHGSQVPQSHASASQAASAVTSPLQSEFSTPRKVAFEWANSGDSDVPSAEANHQLQASGA